MKRLISRREEFSMWLDHKLEVLWHCKIRRDHRMKMGSYGSCYRCGKRIDSTETRTYFL